MIVSMYGESQTKNQLFNLGVTHPSRVPSAIRFVALFLLEKSSVANQPLRSYRFSAGSDSIALFNISADGSMLTLK